MRIYLDNCCLQRPFDDKSQLRILLEAEAVLAVLALYEAGSVEIVSSEALKEELDRNRDPQRKAYVEEILNSAESFVEVDNAIAQRAKALAASGFKGIDALHLACAEAALVDYFCSCDDRLLRRAKSLLAPKVKIVSLLELAEEIT
ncbi:MAG: type II toxin-antitoxin system VapC family toxin [Caldilineaceae bacterium]|nr:type II toxin-antitoxin system VapC family toxin [Caldilineaceae bacterium]